MVALVTPGLLTGIKSLEGQGLYLCLSLGTPNTWHMVDTQRMNE